MTRGQLRKQNQKEETNNQTLGSENEKSARFARTFSSRPSCAASFARKNERA